MKNSILEEESDRGITYLPNSLRHVYNTPSTNGKTKVSESTVNTYPIFFAHDIVPLANSISKLHEMLLDINDISKPVGLKMHLGKTKVTRNKHVNDNVIVDGKKIEEIDWYVYLRNVVNKDHNQVQEMKRRFRQGWGVFCKLRQKCADETE